MELQPIQKRILGHLTTNARTPYKDIAGQLRVSPDTIRYHTEKLLGEPIGEVRAHFDCRMIGYRYHHLLISLKALETPDYDALAQHPRVMYLAKTQGAYHLHLIILVPEDEPPENTTTEIKKHCNGAIHHTSTLEYGKELTFTHLPPTIPPPKTRKKRTGLSGLQATDLTEQPPTTRITLDTTDKRIIAGLLETPRAPYTELAKNAEVSHQTIRNRIQRMIKHGFLQGVALQPHLPKLGLHTHYTLLKTPAPATPQLREHLQSQPHIMYAAQLKGEHDLFLYTAEEGPRTYDQHMHKLWTHIQPVNQHTLVYVSEILKNTQFPTELLTTP